MTPRERITEALAAAYPDGLISAEIKLHCRNLTSKQISNALQKMKGDGLIERGEDDYRYALIDAPARPYQAPSAPQINARSLLEILPKKESLMSSAAPIARPSLDEALGMSQYQRVDNALARFEQAQAPRRIERRNLKTETLTRLAALLDPEIAGVLVAIRDQDLAEEVRP